MALPGKLQQVWDGMEENRAITLGMIGTLPDDAFVRREGGEWSIARILEHLVLAETGTSKLIRKRLNWLCRIVLEHERQHHLQIREIVRKLRER